MRLYSDYSGLNILCTSWSRSMICPLQMIFQSAPYIMIDKERHQSHDAFQPTQFDIWNLKRKVILAGDRYICQLETREWRGWCPGKTCPSAGDCLGDSYSPHTTPGQHRPLQPASSQCEMFANLSSPTVSPQGSDTRGLYPNFFLSQPSRTCHNCTGLRSSVVKFR